MEEIANGGISTQLSFQMNINLVFIDLAGLVGSYLKNKEIKCLKKLN